MTHLAWNGGLEAGLLQAVAEDRTLTDQERARLDYLTKLPPNEWVNLNRASVAVEPHPAAAGSTYRYQLMIRPASVDTTPEGPGRLFTDENTPAYQDRGHGTVYYSEPLSLDDLEHYALLPVSQAQALDGLQFSFVVGGKQVAINTLSVDENGYILVNRCMGEPGTPDYTDDQEPVRYGVVVSLIQTGRWLWVKPT